MAKEPLTLHGHTNSINLKPLQLIGELDTTDVSIFKDFLI